ncbi:hypothetical protein EDD18DRAFT_1121635 [Armillaria luteobubalina]|uniref:DUF6699 domain-containing protein n=1 Tax=Armillaria luteobubalina TaxID=153913 RepID=A0AA39QPB7_9AGAR|nr:hypothetical protein EDD18DRAFT_1121635 [Armillaria luteobubalina]
MGSFDDYNRHGGFYRPAIPLPSEQPFQAPLKIPPAPPFIIKTRYYDVRAHDRNKLVRLIRHILRLDYIVVKREIPMYHPLELDPPVPRYPSVPLSEWKAWGYYAWPSVNWWVSPAPQISVEIDPIEMYNALKSPKGKHHPERWIPGQRLPGLPPRPTRWKRPQPGAPLPFPWECQLNPWLVHSKDTIAPVFWDITASVEIMMMNLDDKCIFLGAPDRAQPATWPFVTHLLINAIMFNGEYLVNWPIMVVNLNGVCCGDIFIGIYDTFQQYVSAAEFDNWSPEVQEEAKRTHRIRRDKDFEQHEESALRRCDYFGRYHFFNGLELNPDRQGWILHLVESRWETM